MFRGVNILEVGSVRSTEKGLVEAIADLWRNKNCRSWSRNYCYRDAAILTNNDLAVLGLRA